MPQNNKYTKRDVQLKIDQINDDPERLAEFLRLIAKEQPDLLGDYIPVLETFLNSEKQEDWYLREVALFGLLSVMKKRNSSYKDRAIQLLNQHDEDEDVRRRASLGLAFVYNGEKDIDVLDAFYERTFDEREDLSLRVNTFVSLLNVYGLESGEINLRCKVPIFNLKSSFFRENLPVFKEELRRIEEIIKLR